jgi:hypothetical protein
MATIVGTLIFEMAANVARLQSDMQKANQTVSGAMNGIKGAASMARTALGALGVAVSVDAFAGMVRGSIEAINNMRELAIKTGNTTEALYGLRPAAKAAHMEMDGVATGLQFLSKNMNDFATTGKGKAVQAFEELGISVTDTSGKLRSSSEVMLEVAQKLTAMEDRTKAVALAKQLLGKAGAQLLPFMEELARIGAVNAAGMNEQGERAHQFMLQLTLLESRSASLKREMAIGLLPSLIKITAAFTELTERKSDTRGFWETVGTLMEWVAKAGNGVWLVMRLVGEAIGAQLVFLERLRNFDLRGALSVYQELSAQMKVILEDAAKVNEKIGELPPMPKQKPRAGEAPGGDGGAGAGAGASFGASNLVSNFAGGGAAEVRELNRQLVDTRNVGREIGNVLEKSAQQSTTGLGRAADAAQRLRELLFRIIQDQVRQRLPDGGRLPDLNPILKDIFAGGFAGGGTIPAGMWGVVGENGPEPVFGGSGGATVLPSSSLGGGDTHVTMVANFNISAIDTVSFMQRAGAMKGMVLGWMAQAYNRRGLSTPIG